MSSVCVCALTHSRKARDISLLHCCCYVLIFCTQFTHLVFFSIPFASLSPPHPFSISVYFACIRVFVSSIGRSCIGAFLLLLPLLLPDVVVFVNHCALAVQSSVQYMKKKKDTKKKFQSMYNTETN